MALNGEWYAYTPASDAYVTLSSNLPQNDGITFSDDTRVSVFTGSCAGLVCYDGSDDVDGTNYLTELGFFVTAGTTYYILWDNRWSSLALDFILTENIPACDTVSSFPFNEDWAIPNWACWTTENANADVLVWSFNGVNDLDGDGTIDNIANVFPGTTNVTKNDWLFSPTIAGTANADYNITITYNAINVNGTANESFDVLALSSASSAAPAQSVLGSYTSITQSGTFQGAGGTDLITQAYTSTVTYTPSSDGDFYIGIHATTTGVESDVLAILSVSVDQTLGIDEYASNTFKHFYDRNYDVLTIKSSDLAFNNIQLYNPLGQEVLNKNLSHTTETLNLSGLQDGVYFAKVMIEGQVQTLKFLKQ